MELPSSRSARGALIGLAAVLLLGMNLVASFSLGEIADATRYSSGIYDMDVSRVVADVTAPRRPYRPSVHPLQKLLVAPVGGLVNEYAFGGDDRLAAAKVLIAFAMMLNALATGWLAAQMTGGSWVPGACATLLCASSFSTLLAATIPESAAFASLGSLVPLLYLNNRIDQPFGRRKAVAWGLIGLFCVAFTLTQVIHCICALVARVYLERRAELTRRLLGRVAMSAALLLALLWLGSEIQSAWYPGTPPVYAATPIESEAAFFRTQELTSTPFRHVARLLRDFSLHSFAAPYPAYSDFLIRDYGFGYWSLSAEEAGLANWTSPQLVVAAVVGLAWFAAFVGLRSAGRSFLAPALCLASQLGLHLIYGREYVLYAPHWHGVLVAVLVAAAWRGLPTRRVWVTMGGVLLAAALLVSNLSVLVRVHEEVAAGLEVDLRDERGAIPAR